MASKLQTLLSQIKQPNEKLRDATQKHLDRLTKPQGSLGLLEEIAKWYACASGKPLTKLPLKRIFTFAADHGVVAEGVSAYPKEVTAQMVYNFIRGGAAINVLARHVNAEVWTIDVGVDHDFGVLDGLISRKVANGSCNMARGPALSMENTEKAIFVGYDLVVNASRQGVGLIATGDMGIGNTTPSSAITAVMTGSPVSTVTGRGTGIDEPMRINKQSVIEKAIAVNRPNAADPLDKLSKVGGLEIAAIVGVILGGAAHHIPVVIDGFISTAAALIAAALKPEVRPYLLAGHQSVEPGHRIALTKLGLSPVLSLDMRLGEGTGAALAMTIVDAAIRICTEMATFESAGVSEKQKK